MSKKPDARPRDPYPQNRSQDRRFWQMVCQNLFYVPVGFRNKPRGVAIGEGGVDQGDATHRTYCGIPKNSPPEPDKASGETLTRASAIARVEKTTRKAQVAPGC